MGTNTLLILASAIAGGLVNVAHAQGSQAPPAQPGSGRVEIAQPVQPPPPGDDRPALVPATREYQWIFHLPVVSIEHRRIVVTALDASTHSKRWDYEVPALRSKRFKLWDAPEFSCKYADLILPNECRTVWRGVYVDVPVLVTERAHVEVDVPRLAMAEKSFVLEIPRWTWTEKSFRFSLPAFAPPETVARLRSSLSAQRAEVTAATEETIASINREIEMARAGGEDPARLMSSDGSSLDLLEERQSLLDQQSEELERLAEIDAELSQLSTPR